MNDDVFDKIIRGELKTEFLFEDEIFVIFKDINPKAPVHYLVVPKKHIASINETQEADTELLGHMILSAKSAARKLGIETGYKLVFNVGKSGGQIVPHIHLHILGGWPNQQSE